MAPGKSALRCLLQSVPARRLVFVALCALAAAPAAAGATTLTAPVFDGRGHLVQTPFVPTAPRARLTKQRALAIVRADAKVHAWLTRYPVKGRTDDESYDARTQSWTVKIWWGKAGEIAEAQVDDASGA